MCPKKLSLTMAACSTLVLSGLAFRAGDSLSDRVLSVCRGTNHQFHSEGCLSCGGLNAPGNAVDECRCDFPHQSDPCSICENNSNGSELGEDLQQGNPPGNPGWLATNSYNCGGQLFVGICGLSDTCDNQVAVKNVSCTHTLQSYAEEGGS